jgi:hypothetical protein
MKNRLPDDPSAAQLETEATDLIALSLLVSPEGEGMDVTDREYSLKEIVRLRATLARMYTGIKETNRALAAAWHKDYPYDSIDVDGEHWWIAPNKKKEFQPNMNRAFAEWLKSQDPEKIDKIITARGLRVSALSGSVRDTFLDEEPMDNVQRIQHKPIKRDRSENGRRVSGR